MENKFPNAPLGFHPEFITEIKRPRGRLYNPGWWESSCGACLEPTAHSSLWLIFQHSPQAVSETILRSIVTDATNLPVHDSKASGPLEYLVLNIAAELWNWQWESLITVSAQWRYI